MTNPKDPQAELRGVLEQFVSELIYNTEHKTGVDPYPRLDEILNIFQAHQQQLLSELLVELPEKIPPTEGIVNKIDLEAVKSTGFNAAIDQAWTLERSCTRKNQYISGEALQIIMAKPQYAMYYCQNCKHFHLTKSQMHHKFKDSQSKDDDEVTGRKSNEN